MKQGFRDWLDNKYGPSLNETGYQKDKQQAGRWIWNSPQQILPDGVPLSLEIENLVEIPVLVKNYEAFVQAQQKNRVSADTEKFFDGGNWVIEEVDNIPILEPSSFDDYWGILHLE